MFLRHLAGPAALVLAGCSAEPPVDAASLGKAPLVSLVADPAEALTFAQMRTASGAVATLIVTRLEGDAAHAVDLTPFGAPLDADVFDVLSALGSSGLRKALAHGASAAAYPIGRLLPAAGGARRHLATGTNFREHAREAEIDGVFNFPKFGPATPPRTTVALSPGALLDYEVEICARFDRAIRSLRDFDAARKGFFLCGDFTDRARLLQLVDPGNVASGRGFSDAKSGPDFFPAGPFLVVPRDWRAFVRSERITTEVEGQPRQDGRGDGMMLDFRDVVRKALTNGGGGSYTFRGAAVPLLVGNTVPRGAVVMSGTPEGVIFRPPRAQDYMRGAVRYIFSGPMLRGTSPQRTMIDAFIDKERRSGRYLRLGEVVRHRSSSMGDLTVRVTSG